MEGSNGRKQQSSSQAGRFEPFHIPTEEACTDQGIIPIAKILLHLSRDERNTEIIVMLKLTGILYLVRTGLTVATRTRLSQHCC